MEEGGDFSTQEFDDGTVITRIVVAGTNEPGIQMTRSLGDLVAKDIGVIAEPSVARWPLENCAGGYCLLASDGIWEFLKESEVSDFVLSKLAAGTSCQDVLRELVEKARGLWKENEG